MAALITNLEIYFNKILIISALRLKIIMIVALIMVSEYRAIKEMTLKDIIMEYKMPFQIK